ncbi:MAG TPA: AI-2E family transporter [Bryobacteraceae bacterium]|nr:AI-2E family transporter [Bryobacteraceae bacterium]
MLGIDRRTLQIAWTLFLFTLILLLVYQIARTLIVFALALFLAHLLSPLVDLVERFFLFRINRTLSLAIVYIVFIGAFVAVAVLLGSKIVEQAAALAGRLPGTVQSNPLDRIPLPSWLEPERTALSQFVTQQLEQLGASILPSLSQAGRGLVTGINGLLIGVLIPILSFLFLLHGHQLRLAILEFFSDSNRPLIDSILIDLHVLLSQYVRALILLSLATFVSFSIALSLLGAPYAVLLAGLAAALEVIPVIGPLVAAIAIVALAWLTGYPHLLVLLIFLALYRIVQDYLLNPYLMSAGVEVPPLLVLFGLLAGEQLAGIPGMFFSVPVIAAIRVVFERMKKSQYVV